MPQWPSEMGMGLKIEPLAAHTNQSNFEPSPYINDPIFSRK